MLNFCAYALFNELGYTLFTFYFLLMAAIFDLRQTQTSDSIRTIVFTCETIVFTGVEHL